jgi:GNAT superfamily N-acetyltransferase
MQGRRCTLQAGEQALPGLVVEALIESDRAAWERLAQGYKAFYGTQLTDESYARTWLRLRRADGIAGLGARLDDELVGFTHFLYHAGTWSPCACYLEDLFVAPAARGRGVGRALIEAVAAQAVAAGARRLYWLTQDHNAVARALYDKVARASGFVEYEYPLPQRD